MFRIYKIYWLEINFWPKHERRHSISDTIIQAEFQNLLICLKSSYISNLTITIIKLINKLHLLIFIVKYVNCIVSLDKNKINVAILLKSHE